MRRPTQYEARAALGDPDVPMAEARRLWDAAYWASEESKAVQLVTYLAYRALRARQKFEQGGSV